MNTHPIIDTSRYELDSILMYTHPALATPLEIPESLLTCWVCTEMFKRGEFITLSCNHNICKVCTGGIMARLAPFVPMKCPFCRAEQTTQSLPPNPFFTSLLDALPYMLVCGEEVMGKDVGAHIKTCVPCLINENSVLKQQMTSISTYIREME